MRRVHVEYLGDSIELPPGETVIGRDIGCALRFNDPAVSRRHLRFIRRAHEVFVEDLSSSNGTLVNGQKVSAPQSLIDGDHVAVGSRVLTVRIVDADLDLEPSTLVLRDFSFSEADPIVQSVPRAMTAPMAAVTVPPPFSGTPTPPSVDSIPIRKRRHDRQPIELDLVYTSSELEVEAVSRDLSESGVFVCSQVLEPVGTSCWLTILVDGGPPLRVKGTVRRVVEHEERAVGETTGLGVEFVDIGAAELAWIRAQIARMSDV